MIKNKKQFTNSDISSIRKELLINSQNAFLLKINNEVKSYEHLTGPYISFLPASDFSKIGLLLIKSRVASGLTQKEVALKLDMKEQQIQRYERSEYGTASIETINKICDAMGIEIKTEAIVIKKCELNIPSNISSENLLKFKEQVINNKQLFKIR